MLTSPKNPKVQAAARLHKRAFRDEARSFLVEGAQGVAVALETAGRLESLFTLDPLDVHAVAAAQLGIPVLHVGDDAIGRLTSTITPQGLVGVAPFVDIDLANLPGDGCIAVLHEVRDPGNAGTVLRSADASGTAAVVFTETSVDPYNPKTVRASAGSIFNVPVVRGAPTVAVIEHVRTQGFRVVAMDVRGSESLYDTDLSGPVAFLFGNEAHGLPQDVVARADATVRVPHTGSAESLNLAAAATVCLFERARRAASRGAALETLIAAAAHDIRSPLTAMKGFGYALERRWEAFDEAQRAVMLRGIVHDVDRMDQIVRLLVDAARIAAGSFEPRWERADLGELVEDIAEMQGRDPDHPALVWTGDPGPHTVDLPRLKTTLLSFAEALVWWCSAGPIEVHAERRGDGLVVTAARAGATLGADELDRLFEPRRPGTGGSKIGLYVARGVAEALGGRAWAELEGDTLRLFVDLPALPGG